MKIINATGGLLPNVILSMASKQYKALLDRRPCKKNIVYSPTPDAANIFIIIIQLRKTPTQDTATIVKVLNTFRITGAENGYIGSEYYPVVYWSGGTPPYIVNLAYRSVDGLTTSRVTSTMAVNFDAKLTDGIGDQVLKGAAREYIVMKKDANDEWWADDLETPDTNRQNAIGIEITDSSVPAKRIFAPFTPDITYAANGITKTGLSLLYDHFGPGTWCLPTIHWVDPAAITYGTALTATQLNATTYIPGTTTALAGAYTYILIKPDSTEETIATVNAAGTVTLIPAGGKIIDVGYYAIRVEFQATDGLHYHLAKHMSGIEVKKADQPVNFEIWSLNVLNHPGWQVGDTGWLVIVSTSTWLPVNAPPASGGGYIITSSNPSALSISGTGVASSQTHSGYSGVTPVTWTALMVPYSALAVGKTTVSAYISGTNNYRQSLVWSVDVSVIPTQNVTGGATFAAIGAPYTYGVPLAINAQIAITGDNQYVTPGVVNGWEIAPLPGTYLEPNLDRTTKTHTINGKFHPSNTAFYPAIMEYETTAAAVAAIPDIEFFTNASYTYGMKWKDIMTAKAYNPMQSHIPAWEVPGTFDYYVTDHINPAWNGKITNPEATPDIDSGLYVYCVFTPTGPKAYCYAASTQTGAIANGFSITVKTITLQIPDYTKDYGTADPVYNVATPVVGLVGTDQITGHPVRTDTGENPKLPPVYYFISGIGTLGINNASSTFVTAGPGYADTYTCGNYKIILKYGHQYIRNQQQAISNIALTVFTHTTFPSDYYSGAVNVAGVLSANASGWGYTNMAFSSSNAAIATVTNVTAGATSGSCTITAVGVGTCLLLIDKPGASDWDAAPQKAVVLVVGKGRPDFTFTFNVASINAGTSLNGLWTLNNPNGVEIKFYLGTETGVPGTLIGASGSAADLNAYVPAASTSFLVFAVSTENASFVARNDVWSGLVVKAIPIITWNALHDLGAITYGATMANSLFTATATIPGTFVYTVGATTVATTSPSGVLTNNNYAPTVAQSPLVINVTFTPTDTVTYTNGSNWAGLTVNKATPVINWPTAPTLKAYGSYWQSYDLSANTSVAGNSFTYYFSGTQVLIGTAVSPVGAHQALNVVFVPTDTVNYNNGTMTVYVDVVQGSAQFSFSFGLFFISEGQTLAAGLPILNNPQNLTVTYHLDSPTGTVIDLNTYAPPANTGLAVYAVTTATANYAAITNVWGGIVVKHISTITWAVNNDLGAIPYGKALDGFILNATANVQGWFVYKITIGNVTTTIATGRQGALTLYPSGGYVPNVTTGLVINAYFTPDDSANYTTPPPAWAGIVVNKAPLKLDWWGVGHYDKQTTITTYSPVIIVFSLTADLPTPAPPNSMLPGIITTTTNPAIAYRMESFDPATNMYSIAMGVTGSPVGSATFTVQHPGNADYAATPITTFTVNVVAPPPAPPLSVSVSGNSLVVTGGTHPYAATWINIGSIWNTTQTWAGDTLNLTQTGAAAWFYAAGSGAGVRITDAANAVVDTLFYAGFGPPPKTKQWQVRFYSACPSVARLQYNIGTTWYSGTVQRISPDGTMAVTWGWLPDPSDSTGHNPAQVQAALGVTNAQMDAWFWPNLNTLWTNIHVLQVMQLAYF